MRMHFQSVWLRLGIGVVILLTLGMTACAAPATKPISVSSVHETAQNEFQAQVILMSPAVAGNNSITVQLRDIKTGKPIHDATVRVAVAEKKHAPMSQDNHASEPMDMSMDMTSTAQPSHQMSGQMDMNMDATPQPSHQMSEMDMNMTPTAQTSHQMSGQMDMNMGMTPTPQPSHQMSGQMDMDMSMTPTPQTTHQMSGQTSMNMDADAQPSHDAGHADKSFVAGQTAGEYVGQVIFPNAGEWLLTVNYEVEGKEKNAMFDVNATRSVDTWIVLSGFLGVNLAVIATAGITKRKALKK